MQSIGSRVKSLRVSKRLTQQELADKIGVKQATVAKIEGNKTKNMGGSTLEALARELSSTSGYILRGADDSEGHEHAMVSAEMAAIFRDLPMADKEMILRMARGILPNKTTPPAIKKTRKEPLA